MSEDVKKPSVEELANLMEEFPGMDEPVTDELEGEELEGDELEGEVAGEEETEVEEYESGEKETELPKIKDMLRDCCDEEELSEELLDKLAEAVFTYAESHEVEEFPEHAEEEPAEHLGEEDEIDVDVEVDEEGLPCPGSKIRSGGKGQGLGRGKGEGPIGVPVGEKMMEGDEGWPEHLKEGRFTEYCKREGFEGPCKACADKAFKSDDASVRGMASWYLNTVKP